MKISKKILGVALAVIMIFNVFAIGAFADFESGDTAVKLTLETDEDVYAPGDEVTITFYVQVNEEIGKISQGGQFEIGYDSKVIQPISTSNLSEDHGVESLCGPITMGGMSIVQFTTNCVDNGSYLDETCIANYGWTDHINFGMMQADVQKTDAVAGPVAVFKAKMKIADNAADGEYTIGYNPGGFIGYNAFAMDGNDWGGLYGQDYLNDLGWLGLTSAIYTYEFGTCTFKVSSAPAVEVYHNGTQARYAYPGTPSADAYQFGFVGGVSGLIPVTELVDGHNNVTNIRKIEAIGTFQGGAVTAEVKTMWLDDNGDYGFRAVFADFDYRETDEITINFVITMEDGTTTYATAEAATDTPNGIYLAAVGRNMPAIPEIA